MNRGAAGTPASREAAGEAVPGARRETADAQAASGRRGGGGVDRPGPRRRPAGATWGWLAAAFACGVLFAAAALELRGGGRRLDALDAAVAGWLRAWRDPMLTMAAIDLTALGSAAVVTLVSVVCCALFALRRDGRAVLHVAVASAGAGALTRLMKVWFERPRPADQPPLVEALGWSFPSGHTVMATALYLSFAVLAWRVFDRRRERAAVLAIALLVIAIVGATRVYLGVHHPSDVLAGLAAGGAWACLLAAGIAYPRAADAEPTGR